MQAGNSDVYGFLEPQSIPRSGQSQFESESYMKIELDAEFITRCLPWSLPKWEVKINN